MKNQVIRFRIAHNLIQPVEIVEAKPNQSRCFKIKVEKVIIPLHDLVKQGTFATSADAANYFDKCAVMIESGPLFPSNSFIPLFQIFQLTGYYFMATGSG